MAQAKTQLVRLRMGKKLCFEVLTKPGAVEKYRAGNLGWDNVLFADIVFKNSSKGDRANSKDLQAAFGTSDEVECLKRIVADGVVQVSASQKRDKVSAKKREIVTYLNRNYTDGKTSCPHPVARLQLALENSKYRVSDKLSTKAQAEELIKILQGVLIFKSKAIDGVLVVSKALLGQVSGLVYKMTAVRREKHSSDAVQWEVGIQPDDFDALIEALNKVTKGDFQFRSMTSSAHGDASDFKFSPQKNGKPKKTKGKNKDRSREKGKGKGKGKRMK